MADAFGIGTSALTSIQQAIKTTGQNIANVNTDGYSRQFVEFSARIPERRGSYFLGSGVEVASVRRAYDQFLTTDFQSRTSSSSYYSSLSETAGRVDELFADSSTGIGPAMNEFFAALEAVANSPTTLPERQVMISQAETLAQRFEYFDTRLSEFQNELNVKIRTSAEDINQYAEVIAELNTQISLQTAQTGGNPSGDLLDQRDQAITELSALIKTTTQTQEDGAINVFIGKGQPLVIGAAASQLNIEPDPLLPNRLNIFVSPDDTQLGTNITSLLDGGEIGAALAAYDDVIDRARRDVGVLAAGLTITFNQVHRAGYGLTSPSSETGGLNFFDPQAGEPPAPKPLGATTTQLSAIIDDPLNPADDGNIALVTGDSYRLDYAAGVLTVRNLSTNEIQALPFDSVTPATFDGVTVSFKSGTLTDGDSYVLSPTESSASRFGSLLEDPNEIAASGSPNLAGDNSNIQALINLQDKNTLVGGTSYNDFYTNSTSKIAVQASRATSLAETEAALLASAQSRRGNLTGVNLEEEAANLIRFQQAFQAAAQVIATARDVFDVLIRATE